MKRSILTTLALLSTLFLAGINADAQLSYNYFQAVTNLNPAAYWPMHETTAPALGDIETNYGTLGALGTGYYPDWLGTTSLIQRHQPGAIAGDSDTSVFFAEPNSNAGGPTNALSLPHTSPLTTLVPPFSVECWFNGFLNSLQGDIWSQSGFEGLNAGNLGGGNGSVCGIRLYWNAPHITLYNYRNSSTLNTVINTSGNTSNTWYHLVVTCDANTNFTLWINGNQAGQGAGATTYQPDFWSAFEVGSGRGNTRALKGYVDEVAIYTNVLLDVSTHYNVGITAGSNPSYFQTVLADNPIVYYRMDGPAYSQPTVASWPVVTNYGTTGGNGVYSPGTIPGVLPGPSGSSGSAYSGFPGVSTAVLGGVSSYADVGNSSAFNPTGPNAFSVTALFRGNPCDGRIQTIVGHSDNSWRITMNNNGKLQAQLGTNITSLVNSSNVYNDGLWHQVALVYSPGSTSTTPGTNFLYVDGFLDNFTNNVTPNGILPGTNLDAMIGTDPQYTNNPNGLGRQFAGQICDVAVFSYALSPSNIATLYNAAGVSPSILTQPISASANQGANFTNTVVARGAAPLSYQWYKDNSPIPTQTNSSLILSPVGANDASTNYFVVVTNLNGAVTSSVVSLTVYSSPTILSYLPVPHTNLYTLFSGVNLTFSLTSVSGATPLNYQWYYNSAAVTGATNNNFALTNVQPGSISVYCVVSNFVGVTTSFVWNASVLADPSAPYPQSVLGLKPIGYWRLSEPDDGMGDGGAGIIAHDYIEGNDGVFTNTLLGQTGYNTHTDSGTTSPYFGYVAYQDSDAFSIAGIDFASPTNTSKSFSIEAWVNGPSQNLDAGIVNKGYSGKEQFNLDTGSDGGTPSHAYRFFVRGVSGTVYAVNSSVQPGSVWHHLVGVCDESNSVLNFYIDGFSVGSTLIPAGNGIGSSTNLMVIGSRQSSQFTNNNWNFSGYINDVAIYNYALSASQVLSNYLSAGVPPQFTVQPPTTATASEGGTLTLSALAVGSGTVTYQWQDSYSSSLVTSQTSTNLVINNVPASLNGDILYVTATDAYGQTNSTNVYLTVISGPPQIIVSNLPPQVSLVPGKSFPFSVTASGTLPLSYQWYNHGTAISGANASSYSLVTSVGGSYAINVVVTNSYGSVTSTVSQVTTIAPLSNSYASAVLNLNPVGYWPLQETNAPGPGNWETNYGTLGQIANAYYAPITPSILTFGNAGAIAGDSDTAVGFSGVNGNTPQSYAFVPRLSPALTMNPPFSWEMWLNAPNGNFGDVLAEGGGEGLNGGNWAGFRLSWANNLQVYADDGTITGTFTSSFSTTALTPNAWHYCVVTYDGSTANVYADGSTNVIGSGSFTAAPDTWTPFSIGAGRFTASPPNPTRGFDGMEDEVAVYTNILTSAQMTAHYQAGTTSGNYKQTILNDKPLLYYRMDNPSYVAPNPSLYPAAYNYGSAAPNGAYMDGIRPGGISGPSMPAVGNTVAAPINGVNACVDAGFDASYNPAGTQALTALTWFRTYPADARLQTIMGQGLNWSLNLDGGTGRVVWNLGSSGGSVISSNVLNDGNWHFVAGVFNGSTSSLYVDGNLNASASAGTLTGDSADNLYLGGNAAYGLVGTNMQFFAGALAQAALFTNALSASQIQQIYDAANPALPTISISTLGNQVIITYTGTLMSASAANGAYTVVNGAHSPYTIPASGTQQFYRTRNP